MTNALSGNDLIMMVIIALWTLPWKGVALWKAVQRNEKKWFIALLILNTLAILEILYIFYFSKRPPTKKSTTAANADTLPKLPDHPEKESNKQKIIEALAEWKKISSNTVGRLLNVPDVIAALYLEELAREKKIKPSYKTEEDIFYCLRN